VVQSVKNVTTNITTSSTVEWNNDLVKNKKD